MNPDTDTMDSFRVFAEDRLKAYLEKPEPDAAPASPGKIDGIPDRIAEFEKELDEKVNDLSGNHHETENRLSDIRAIYVDILRNSNPDM
jgi:hypothetical protein